MNILNILEKSGEAAAQSRPWTVEDHRCLLRAIKSLTRWVHFLLSYATDSPLADQDRNFSHRVAEINRELFQIAEALSRQSKD